MTSQLPRVSVLVPVYNDERHVGTALKTALEQTHKNLEVIVSDDASSDDSAKVARRFAERDSRVKLVVQPINLGMTRNWNAALAMATGDYVCKLDSDDAYRSRFVEELLSTLMNQPSALVAFCRTLQCDSELEPVASYLGDAALIRQRIDPLLAHIRPGHVWYRHAFDDLQLWHSNAFLCRTDTLRGIGGWDASYGCASDTDLILRLLEANKPVAHVPYAGALYRIRNDSVSANYRRSSLLTLESSIVHLRSLQRYRERGGAVDGRLRFAWQRFYAAHANTRGMLESAEEWAQSSASARLRSASEQISTPPLLVRVRSGLDAVRTQVLRLLGSRRENLPAGPRT